MQPRSASLHIDSRTVVHGDGGSDVAEFLRYCDRDGWDAIVQEIARIAAMPRHRYRERASALLAGFLSLGSWTDDDDDAVADFGADDA